MQEPKKVVKLTMNIRPNCNWSTKSQEHRLAFYYCLALLNYLIDVGSRYVH